MFSQLETLLISFIHTIPLEAFVFIASIVEEIIAPIPSPTVMIISGSFAEVQGRTVLALIPLALIGAVGKTCGGLVVYFIADKLEYFLMGTFGKFFHVSHEDVQKLGDKLGNGVRDYFLLTFLRALPIMPSVVVSAGSGILKIPLRLFIVTTFLGTIIRDGIYLYAGYIGLQIFKDMLEGTSKIETFIEVVIAIVVIIFLLYRRYAQK